jgi:hypothetical protein
VRRGATVATAANSACALVSALSGAARNEITHAPSMAMACGAVRVTRAHTHRHTATYVTADEWHRVARAVRAMCLPQLRARTHADVTHASHVLHNLAWCPVRWRVSTERTVEHTHAADQHSTHLEQCKPRADRRVDESQQRYAMPRQHAHARVSAHSHARSERAMPSLCDKL